MAGFMQEIFGLVCGQNPAHTWAPGGELLPLCQRCTGLYVGAALALLLLILYRPPIDIRYRWLHAMLLLAMTPFGFHLVPHGEVLRTMSGHWFGFGSVGLLWLMPGELWADKGHRKPSLRSYLLLGLMSLISVPVFAQWGGALAAVTLSWLALAGLAAIAGLLLGNLILLLYTMITWFRLQTGAVVP
jgi:uncharacterized membrane protein